MGECLADRVLTSVLFFVAELIFIPMFFSVNPLALISDRMPNTHHE
jgi:hypothetical protein